MYHTIRFNEAMTVDVEISRKQPLERVTVRRGARTRAQVRPYVIDTEDGPVEMADLYFEDSTVTRGIRYADFSFEA